MKKIGQVVYVKPGRLEEYKALHRAVWPEVLEKIKECGITNYSIFSRDNMLFTYFEYVGDDYERDMAKMAEHIKTQEWWSVCKPCLQRIETEAVSDCWADMEQIFDFN